MCENVSYYLYRLESKVSMFLLSIGQIYYDVALITCHWCMLGYISSVLDLS